MKFEDYWGIVYAIMKSLNLNELVIEDKYYNITPNDLYGMYITKDIVNNKTIVTIKENDIYEQ